MEILSKSKETLEQLLQNEIQVQKEIKQQQDTQETETDQGTEADLRIYVGTGANHHVGQAEILSKAKEAQEQVSQKEIKQQQGTQETETDQGIKVDLQRKVARRANRHFRLAKIIPKSKENLEQLLQNEIQVQMEIKQQQDTQELRQTKE